MPINLDESRVLLRGDEKTEIISLRQWEETMRRKKLEHICAHGYPEQMCVFCGKYWETTITQ